MSKPNAKRLLYELANSCIKLNKSFKPTEKLETQCQQLSIPKLLRLIDFKQLGILQGQSPVSQGIGICNLYEHTPLRLSVYFLPQGQTMKLHDHPGMEVLSYLISGTMQAKLFTHLQNDLYRRQMLTLKKGHCSFIDGALGKEQNLHEFYAVEPSYFLDIIFPDYDISRPCRFFEEKEVVDEEKVRLKEVLDYEVQFFSLP